MNFRDNTPSQSYWTGQWVLLPHTVWHIQESDQSLSIWFHVLMRLIDWTKFTLLFVTFTWVVFSTLHCYRKTGVGKWRLGLDVLCGYYRPQTKLQEGHVFTGVWLSADGRSVSLVLCPFWEGRGLARGRVCKVYLYRLHTHRIQWSCEGLTSIPQQIHWIQLKHLLLSLYKTCHYRI